jgi:hypothetical protein
MTLASFESMAVRLHARAWKPGVAATSLAMAVPAYAATAFDPAAWSWNEMLLAGSVALLAVAVVARIWQRDESPAPPDAPDLRWWRNGGDDYREGAMQ